MSLWLLLVPIGAGVLVLVGCLVAAACGVDGFRGDKRREVHMPAPSAMPQPAPAALVRPTTLRVVAQRVDQVEAA